MRRAIVVVAVLVAAVLVALSAVAYAKQPDRSAPSFTTPDKSDGPITSENHAWANYHWARTSNPFTLRLDDNVTSAWDSYLVTTSTHWSKSSVLDTAIVASTNTKRCRATKGRVEVCNAKYGNNDWLGIASIWVSGDHITQGTTKVNDTYFNTAKYNTPAWRNLVMCQEVGHNFGLAHQDEDFNNENLGTCMDYASDPDGDGSATTPDDNQHPNQHDYDQLEAIYSHLDSTTTVGQTTSASKGSSEDNEPGNGPPAWGREIFRSVEGRVSIYEKGLGRGKKVTHVLWTEERAAKHRGEHKGG